MNLIFDMRKLKLREIGYLLAFLSLSQLRLQSKRERIMRMFLFLDGRILFPSRTGIWKGLFNLDACVTFSWLVSFMMMSALKQKLILI